MALPVRAELHFELDSTFHCAALQDREMQDQDTQDCLLHFAGWALARSLSADHAVSICGAPHRTVGDPYRFGLHGAAVFVVCPQPGPRAAAATERSHPGI